MAVRPGVGQAGRADSAEQEGRVVEEQKHENSTHRWPPASLPPAASSCFYARRGICGMTDVAAEPRPSDSWLRLGGGRRTGSRRRTERACFALAFERCSKPCFGPSEGVGGALAPAGGPNVRGCQPLSAAPGVTPGAPSPAAAPKKGTRMHVRTRAASLQLYVQPEFIVRILPLR